MKYQVLVLDLDGTLTNSKKEITAPTKQALLEIQEAGRTVVLASGRPINGVAPLAKELQMDTFGGYMLSFNGARITKCSTGEIIYNKTIPKEIIRPVWEYVKTFPGLDIISYDDTHIFSGICPNKYVEIESGINNMEIVPTDDFPSALDFPVNKLLICGDPKTLETMIEPLRKQYHGLLNIYLSEPFFLEIMPKNMICCGDGFNDLSMIEYAGLGVAMENAQPIIKETADFITRSNDEDGVLHVIDTFMR